MGSHGGKTQGSYTQEPQLLRFRRRLSLRMRDLGYGPVELAEEVGQSRQCVVAWLCGIRLPQAVSMIRLARALDVPADWLLGEDESECARRAIRLHAVNDGHMADRPAGEDALA